MKSRDPAARGIDAPLTAETGVEEHASAKPKQSKHITQYIHRPDFALFMDV
jgi:hypothetical protein